MTDISTRGLTKHFGPVRAVQDLTFDAPAGRITGFLGPNGAGKTTTLRMLLGLVEATSGQALIGGQPYRRLAAPRRVVGAVLESTGFHPGRTARDHLRVLAPVAGASAARIDEVLDVVALTEDADRRVGGFSLGMRQRLGLAAALLGDPAVLLLDEPANGLDPEGIAWLRGVLRQFAADGRTVLISSHVLSEVAQTVDRVVIIDGGRLRFAGPLGDLGDGRVTVRTDQATTLRDMLAGRGFDVVVTGDSSFDVRGASPEEIGRVAASARIALSGLSEARPSLEAAFLELTGSGGAPAPAGDAH